MILMLFLGPCCVVYRKTEMIILGYWSSYVEIDLILESAIFKFGAFLRVIMGSCKKQVGKGVAKLTKSGGLTT